MKSFEEIEVYQKAINFTVEIFKTTENSKQLSNFIKYLKNSNIQ